MAMECQTLPSTSSLSGANSAELAPRRKTTLPKAAVFILPKRTSARYPSQDAFYSGASAPIPPSSPLSLSPSPTDTPGTPDTPDTTDTTDTPDDDDVLLEAMDVDNNALPAELRGRVRLLPRLPLVEYEPANNNNNNNQEDSLLAQQHSHIHYNYNYGKKLQLRRPRHATTDNSGLRQLMPHGARVAIGGSIHAAEAVLALSTSTAIKVNNNTAGLRRASPCPYDEFVSTHKPSFWRRFKSKVKASLGPTPGPKPNLPSIKIPGECSST